MKHLRVGSGCMLVCHPHKAGLGLQFLPEAWRAQMYISHSWKGTIGYVKVRYECGESEKMGQSLREREGIRKELWYVDDQLVYESRLRIRAKGQSHEKQKEFRETGDSGSFTGPGRFSCRL